MYMHKASYEASYEAFVRRFVAGLRARAGTLLLDLAPHMRR